MSQFRLPRWVSPTSAATVAAATSSRAAWRSTASAATATCGAWSLRPPAAEVSTPPLWAARSGQGARVQPGVTVPFCVLCAGEEVTHLEFTPDSLLQPSADKTAFIDRLANSITKRKRSTPQKFLGEHLASTWSCVEVTLCTVATPSSHRVWPKLLRSCIYEQLRPPTCVPLIKGVVGVNRDSHWIHAARSPFEQVSPKLHRLFPLFIQIRI